MKENPPPRDEALRLMAANPNLIKRPILASRGSIALGLTEEEFEKLL
jgi:arsenate reductase-like glutaredoxin family protein